MSGLILFVVVEITLTFMMWQLFHVIVLLEKIFVLIKSFGEPIEEGETITKKNVIEPLLHHFNLKVAGKPKRRVIEQKKEA